MKVYKKNITRFCQFYTSDYFKKLEKYSPELIPIIFETLNYDPDDCDEELYKQLGEKYGLPTFKTYLKDTVNGVSIRLAADIVCGRKQIVELNNGVYEHWIQDYNRVRGTLDLHFLWPKHKAPTINTYRYTKYLDRIDYLLFDLKKYFSGEDTPMKPAYIQPETRLWLSKFADFKDFVLQMRLEKFVDRDYEVLDISSNNYNVITEFVSRKQIKDTLPNYLRNMIKMYAEK